jgi:mannose-1-phosphate guanylyltransferase
LIEPSARGTAACLALAAAHIARRDPAAVMAAFPADHAIADVAGFRRSVEAAFAAAREGDRLVTIGIPPTGPETGFGYIEVSVPHRRRARRATTPAVEAATRFVEKPDLRTAKRFVASGRYLWNAGMFIWRVDVFRAALERHAPAIARVMDGLGHGDAAARLRYAALPSAPIDTAVMEKAEHVVAVRATFDWSDVGSWAAMAALWGADGRGNATRGPALLLDCRGTVVYGERRLIAVLGARDLIVVDSPDAVLVCPRSRAQDVRRLVEGLNARLR